MLAEEHAHFALPFLPLERGEARVGDEDRLQWRSVWPSSLESDSNSLGGSAIGLVRLLVEGDVEQIQERDPLAHRFAVLSRDLDPVFVHSEDEAALLRLSAQEQHHEGGPQRHRTRGRRNELGEQAGGEHRHRDRCHRRARTIRAVARRRLGVDDELTRGTSLDAHVRSLVANDEAEEGGETGRLDPADDQTSQLADPDRDAFDVRPAHVGASKFRAGKVGAGEIAVDERDAGEVAPLEVGVAQLTGLERDAGESPIAHRPVIELAVDESNVFELRLDELSARSATTAEQDAVEARATPFDHREARALADDVHETYVGEPAPVEGGRDDVGLLEANTVAAKRTPSQRLLAKEPSSMKQRSTTPPT